MKRSIILILVFATIALIGFKAYSFFTPEAPLSIATLDNIIAYDNTSAYIAIGIASGLLLISFLITNGK